MRSQLTVVRALVLVLSAACSSGGNATPTPTPTAATPTASATATASATPAQTPTSTPSPTATATAAPTATATVVSTAAPTVAPTAAPAPRVVATSITNFAFEATITVPAGSTVTWTNKDGSPHTVSAAWAFDSGTLNENQSFSQRFNTRGTFAYLCSIHPFMTGNVVVQ